MSLQEKKSNSNRELARDLDRAQLYNALKAEALSLIGALYGPKHPGYWDLDIVTGTIPNIESGGKKDIAKDLYVTRAIMFTNKNYRDWAVAKEGSGEWHTAHRSMEEFVKELRGEFGKLTVANETDGGDTARVMMGLENVGEESGGGVDVEEQ